MIDLSQDIHSLSDFKRKTAWNGEQQIYVDPRYGGRATTPLGLDPFTAADDFPDVVTLGDLVRLYEDSGKSRDVASGPAA